MAPIDEKFLGVGDLFGLRFDEGIVGLSVETWSELKYRPHTQISEVSSQNDSSLTRLNDGSGNDILFIEGDEELVYHVGIGQRPASLRRYTRYPEDGSQLRPIQNLTSPSSRSGDDYGYVDGNDSPYEQPTDAEELFIPPGVHLNFNFYNPNSNETVDPVLNIKFREYKVRFIDPTTDRGRDLMRRIVSPGSPIPIGNVGSQRNQVNVDETGWDVTVLPKNEVDNLLNQ